MGEGGECEGPYYACGWVDVAGYCVDGDDVGCFVVPGTVFSPIGCRYFLP